MKKTLKSLFETGVLHLVVLCLIFALALVVSGCRSTTRRTKKAWSPTASTATTTG